METVTNVKHRLRIFRGASFNVLILEKEDKMKKGKGDKVSENYLIGTTEDYGVNINEIDKINNKNDFFKLLLVKWKVDCWI